MTYDHWKTTEPQSGYDPPDEFDDEASYEDAVGRLKDMGRKYRDALRKIAAWQGYEPHEDHWRDKYVVDQYERGANDMLATLKQIAEEALG